MGKYTVIFAGTPDFSCPALESLIQDDRFNVKAVISQKDKPIGRKQIVMPTPVKRFALKYGIPIFQPEKLNEIKEKIGEIKPDFFVVIAYGQIIPEAILKIAKWNINLHGSILPKYRGASPIQSALLNGDKETGLSVMNIEKKMDAGAVYRTYKIHILPEDNSETVFNKLMDLSKYLPEDLNEIANGLEPIPQDESIATYCKKIEKKDGEIDFENEIAEEIFNKMKAFTPWPGVFFIHNGKRVKILSGLIDKDKGIKTKKDFFLPLKVLPEGKKEQSYEEWVRNNS